MEKYRYDMKLVIAGTYAQFKDFVLKQQDPFKAMIKKANGISPLAGYKYCSRPEDLWGYEPGRNKILYTGEFWKNKLYDSPELKRFDPFPPALPISTWADIIFKNMDYGKMEQSVIQQVLKEYSEKDYQVTMQVHDSILLEVKDEK